LQPRTGRRPPVVEDRPPRLGCASKQGLGWASKAGKGVLQLGKSDCPAGLYLHLSGLWM